MAGLLDQSIINSLLYNYQNEYLDPAGFPIDVKRPIVYDEGKNEPHTELSATFKAEELGLPGNVYYNVPTIYNGKILNPNKDFDLIRENVQNYYKEGYQMPAFKDEKTAIENAISRSKSIGNIRNQELEDSIRARQRNMLMGLLGQ